MPSTTKTAIVIGARTERQGTGPFIAAGLNAAGVAITGIVGTSTQSVAEARLALQRDWQLSPEGFTDLEQAVTALQPDAVAICTPWSVHAQQLQAVAELGCHCLVEKPMAWPASAAQVDAIIRAFEARNLLLQVVNQWPTTLGTFAELHGGLPAQIDQFQMRLSPISIGSDMITDSAPHFLGMLQALCGQGDCTDIRIEHVPAAGGEQALEISCNYRHDKGMTCAKLRLQTQQARPRPAWFQINELRADREVELPEYRQYLVHGGRRTLMQDPMHLVARAFATALYTNDTTDGEALRASHRNLLQLALAPQPF